MRALISAARASRRQAWLLKHRKAFRASAGPRPRLLVDVSTIIRHDAQTGIQRVVRGVWSELLKRDGQGFQLVPVHASHTRGYCYASVEAMDRAGARLTFEPVSARPGDRFLGLDLSAHFLPKYRRQLRAWRDAGATLHLMVYDLLPILRPDWFNRAAQAHFRKWFSVLIEEVDQAICISQQVARDLRARLHDIGAVRPPSIANMRLGGDISASRPSSGISAELATLLGRFRFRPTILMVGTVEPRKGYETALAAFEHLWATRGSDAPDLVIVGKPGWKTEALQRRLRQHPESGRRLHWLSEVSDEGLCELYDASRGLLMASRGEGMGLPLLEAVMHARPVLARDLPVFQEQGLPNVQFFQDDSPQALAEPLMRLVTARRESPPPSVHLPTWSDSVDELLARLGLPAQPGGATAKAADDGVRTRA